MIELNNNLSFNILKLTLFVLFLFIFSKKTVTILESSFFETALAYVWDCPILY